MNDAAVMTELGVNLEYQLRYDMRLALGYTFLGVERRGSHVVPDPNGGRSRSDSAERVARRYAACPAAVRPKQFLGAGTQRLV